MEALGRRLAPWLWPGAVVAVRGPLGAGKTVFCRGVLAELVGGEVFQSPTFTLVHTYQGRPPLAVPVHHADFYRLADEADDLAELFLPPAIALVEWPERAPGLLPPERLDVAIALAGEARVLTAAAHGPAAAAALRRWQEGRA
jgi:tRNA threonylcarbamoyl adenosine modification protein YjeE